MGPHAPFEPAEYAARVSAARAALARRDLAALLVFAQESHYYLFGYDGGGYVFFQCALLTADAGPVTLLCRRPDRAQARDTSSIEDIRVWLNAEDADPAAELREILRERGLAGARVGIETDSFGCTGRAYADVAKAMDGFCELEEASDVVRRLRLVKSPAEQALVREAGNLADRAVLAVRDAAAPGVLDSVLTARCLAAMLEGGGDVPPAGPLVNSGSRAVYGRGVGGPRALSAQDLVMVELAGTRRRYNCCIERAVVVGPPRDADMRLHDLVESTLAEMLSAFGPGRVLGEVDEIHRRRLDQAGYEHVRYAACGYSLGATYRPSWMDVPPMIYAGNPLVMEPGMVFFPHVMLGVPDTGQAMGLGNTVLVTDTGAASLTSLELDLLVA